MKQVFYGFLALLSLLLLFIGYTTKKDNFWLDWERDVPSKYTVAELEKPFKDLKLWPVYYHSLKEVTLLNATELKSGVELRYDIEPKGKEWKRFELYASAVEVSMENPNSKKMSFKLKEDSKKKLTAIFDDFEWEITITEASDEFKKRGFQSMIHGHARAHTDHWRGRFFGTLSPRILMNQVFYVDLVKLSQYEAQLEALKENKEPQFQ